MYFTLTLKWLDDRDVCREGRDWFYWRYGRGPVAVDRRFIITVREKSFEWLEWLVFMIEDGWLYLGVQVHQPRDTRQYIPIEEVDAAMEAVHPKLSSVYRCSVPDIMDWLGKMFALEYPNVEEETRCERS